MDFRDVESTQPNVEMLIQQITKRNKCIMQSGFKQQIRENKGRAETKGAREMVAITSSPQLGSLPTWRLVDTVTRRAPCTAILTMRT